MLSINRHSGCSRAHLLGSLSISLLLLCNQSRSCSAKLSEREIAYWVDSFEMATMKSSSDGEHVIATIELDKKAPSFPEVQQVEAVFDINASDCLKDTSSDPSSLEQC
jgi:hypothetical protein